EFVGWDVIFDILLWSLPISNDVSLFFLKNNVRVVYGLAVNMAKKVQNLLLVILNMGGNMLFIDFRHYLNLTSKNHDPCTKERIGPIALHPKIVNFPFPLNITKNMGVPYWSLFCIVFLLPFFFFK
ncbi:hypothetical protein ACJX0J_005579, partial [Zea mays]